MVFIYFICGFYNFLHYFLLDELHHDDVVAVEQVIEQLEEVDRQAVVVSLISKTEVILILWEVLLYLRLADPFLQLRIRYLPREH